MKFLYTLVLWALAFTNSAFAQPAPIKFGLVDGSSGANGYIGESMRQHLQFFADRFNAAGGMYGGRKVEVLAFDNKFDPQETTVQLQKAIDAGVQYVFHGNSSAVGHAIVDYLDKHNRRNPDKTVLYINFAALDPALTGEKCNFWHFRFDGDVAIRTTAMVNQLKQDAALKKVYLLNQDYSFGKAIRDMAVQLVKEKRPDVAIVENELIPLQKVNDFTPYISKMRASGAQAVITGNWGNDLNQMIKTGSEMSLPVKWYTYFANGEGSVTALGAPGVGRVFAISEWHMNERDPATDKMAAEFRAKYNRDFFFYRLQTAYAMLQKAMTAANSSDPKAVALKLEGMTQQTPFGDVYMRAADHQIFQPFFVAVMADDTPIKLENSPYGFKTVGKSTAKETEVPTTCKMVRP